MSKENITTESGVSIQIPVKIRLEALEKVLQDKLVGFKIQKEEDGAKQFGEILSINLSSGIDDYGLCIQQEILMKTFLFKNKKIGFKMQLNFEYNQKDQELVIKNYKVEGEKKSWLTNILINVVMGLLFKKKLSNNFKLELTPKISELLNQINDKLKNILEVKKGINLFGAIDTFKVNDLYFKEDGLVALINIQGNLAAEVSEIELSN
ncbi:DUF4403 family protein [Mesonia aestuariivivens]|uniref:DUF4403 family protein n=1 Tax=Mesonia aestuariivivens TaxID=2796128 RepID=A0ABS6W3X3_9FLAO|nr:DUF4403 family protein [Mesonia aestuariivivens]MBW2961784.1 DUF4403 family protein [Mesonia aestuariivivens]